MNTWTLSDIAYFAGIIDGEGCFCLHNAGSHKFSAQLQVGNTDVRLIEWIHQRFGGSVGYEKRKLVQHKNVWRWYVGANEAEAVIRAILPYLVIKRDQAELFLAYRATIAPRVRTSSTTAKTSDAVKGERYRIHTALSALNQRGKAVNE